MNRREFRRLADLRLADARTLLAARRYSAVYYLAGYAVECGLKACIAKQFKQSAFPPRETRNLYTHKPEILVVSAQLQGSLASQKRASPAFAQNWSIVNDWSEESRYQTWTRQEAVALLDAITNVPDGVMAWIRGHW